MSRSDLIRPTVERLRCRCGEEVLSNSTTLTIAHPYPECAWFQAALRENPPDRTMLRTEDQVIFGKRPVQGEGVSPPRGQKALVHASGAKKTDLEAKRQRGRSQ